MLLQQTCAQCFLVRKQTGNAQSLLQNINFRNKTIILALYLHYDINMFYGVTVNASAAGTTHIPHHCHLLHSMDFSHPKTSITSSQIQCTSTPTQSPKLATLTFITNCPAIGYYISTFSESQLALNVKKETHEIYFL